MQSERSSRQAETVPLQQVLKRVCEQLRESEVLIDELEELISDLLMSQTGLTSGGLSNLQNIDLIRQQIAGLGDFLDALKVHLPENWVVDIQRPCSSVRLAELAARLAAGNSHPIPIPHAPDDLDLFQPLPETAPLRRSWSR